MLHNRDVTKSNIMIITRSTIAQAIRTVRNKTGYTLYLKWANYPGAWKFKANRKDYGAYCVSKAMETFGKQENEAWKVACAVRKVVETGFIAANRDVSKNKPVLAVKEMVGSVELLVPMAPITSDVWGIADASGAAGDVSPGINRLVQHRARLAVWRKLEALFTQLQRFPAWLLQKRTSGELQEHVITYGATTKPFGPETRDEWMALAAACVSLYNASKA